MLDPYNRDRPIGPVFYLGAAMQTPEPVSPDLLAFVGAILISIVSGFISIAQRIIRGREASLLWVTSEFLAAILCGYLMFDAYPDIAPKLPVWMTQPVMVAIAAHIGGRSMQGIEGLLYQRYGVTFKKPPDG